MEGGLVSSTEYPSILHGLHLLLFDLLGRFGCVPFRDHHEVTYVVNLNDQIIWWFFNIERLLTIILLLY